MGGNGAVNDEAVSEDDFQFGNSKCAVKIKWAALGIGYNSGSSK